MASDFTYHGGGVVSKTRKRDGKRIFYARVYWQGRYHVHKAGSTERKALTLAAQLQAQIDDGTYISPGELRARERKRKADRLTFKKFGEKYLADGKRRWKGYDWHRDMVKVLTNGLGSQYLQDLTTGRVARYLTERRAKVKASTLNHELRYLRTMLNVAVAWGLIPTNPAQRIKPDREEYEEREALTAKQKKKVLETADEEFRPVIRFALLTGMRIGEIAGLTWDRVNVKAGTVRLTNTKSGKPRTVPLVKEAREILKGLPRRIDSPVVFEYQGLPLITYDGKKGRRVNRYLKAWQDACKDSGVTGSFHITRHTFASDYVMRGGNPFDLIKICGWTDYAMVQERYGHLAPDYLQDAVKIMNGAAG